MQYRWWSEVRRMLLRTRSRSIRNEQFRLYIITSWDEAIRECKRLLETGETQVVFDKCWKWMNKIEDVYFKNN